MERLRKFLAEVEADEDPDFDNEDNGPEDIVEEIFSDHESFCEYDTGSGPQPPGRGPVPVRGSNGTGKPKED
ncbi:hypothetical protein AVEN_56419-1 [Araneus ventricosus]|uniref:Uncharacterized protein n=1 Tax=Araneus ventricosus TaxID=182803 RepID=A0A4Y2JSY0_ARAVE|nr:hypothetical protein AVEN_56419-1 [Araneus ventricosus]